MTTDQSAYQSLLNEFLAGSVFISGSYVSAPHQLAATAKVTGETLVDVVAADSYTINAAVLSASHFFSSRHSMPPAP